MNDSKELRTQVKNYIDVADDDTVKQVLNLLENKEQKDWWDELPQEVQGEIDVAIKELDEGKSFSFEQVQQMYPQWFKK